MLHPKTNRFKISVVAWTPGLVVLALVSSLTFANVSFAADEVGQSGGSSSTDSPTERVAEPPSKSVDNEDEEFQDRIPEQEGTGVEGSVLETSQSGDDDDPTERDPNLVTKCQIPLGTYGGTKAISGVEVRFGGKNRYQTSAAILAHVKSKPVGEKSALFVASGRSFADALSLSALAAHTNWPIVLTAVKSLDPKVREAISKQKPTHIYIAGGPNAVSKAVENEIVALAGGAPEVVKRFAGADRYQTSAQIAQCFEEGTRAFIATGRQFPDAVISAAPAAQFDGAVLLTDGFRLSPTPKKVLGILKPTKIYMIGGKWANAELDAAKKASTTGATVKVYAGKDRYATSVAVAKAFFGTGKKPVVFSVGTDFPDAIAGAAIADFYSAPIVLTKSKCYPASAAEAVGIANMRILLGGKTALSSIGATKKCVPPVLIIRDPANIKVLVNKKNPLKPKTFVPKLMALSSVGVGGGEYMQPEAAKAMGNMVAAARKSGVHMEVWSGYRSYATQASLFDNYVRRSGVARAETYSARPGYSEHQTGLAADMAAPNEGLYLSAGFGATNAGRWVKANAWRYGFIVRYPEGYTHITGYIYEPWHVRYVGTAVAKNMRDKGIKTYEQYVKAPAAPGY